MYPYKQNYDSESHIYIPYANAAVKDRAVISVVENILDYRRAFERLLLQVFQRQIDLSQI